MDFLQQKAFRGLGSPSNLAMAALIGFLAVGYFTDWKMLRGRPSLSASAVTPGLPEHLPGPSNVRIRAVRLERGGTIYLHVAPRSEIADRRAASHEGQNGPEVD